MPVYLPKHPPGHHPSFIYLSHQISTLPTQPHDKNQHSGPESYLIHAQLPSKPPKVSYTYQIARAQRPFTPWHWDKLRETRGSVNEVHMAKASRVALLAAKSLAEDVAWGSVCDWSINCGPG